MLSTKPWRPELVIFCGIALFTSICASALLSGVLRHFHVHAFNETDDLGNIILGTFGFQGVAWLLIWIFLKRHNVRLGEALGVRNPRWLRALGIALGVFVVILPAAWLLQSASINLMERFGWSPQSQLAVELLEKVTSRWARGYLAVFALVLAPVAEEFIFRGVLYPLIKQLGWPKLAFVSTSFLFALIHLNVETFVPLFALALALTWLYEFTDVLLAPILVHVLFNGANLAMLVLQHLGYVSTPP